MHCRPNKRWRCPRNECSCTSCSSYGDILWMSGIFY
uniref:Uncharacterized protein n=1 Tax=Schistosoma japonicum TaxID=6182 RepID=Q5C1S9_SCHJA|nr:unknown [Schistosoma japonicum]